MATAAATAVAGSAGYDIEDTADRDRVVRKEQRQARAAEVQHGGGTVSQPARPEEWVSGAGERRDEVERVLARLPASARPHALDRARQGADRALGAEDGTAFAAGMKRLRIEVQMAQDADRRRRATVAEVARLRSQLDGLDGDAVADVREQLAQVDLDRALPSGLASAVAEAAEAARVERDRSFVLDAMGATLADLGYEVEDGFATAVAAEGAVVPLPWSGEHGVQVREQAGNLLFNVVRYVDDEGRAADAVADRHAEQRFCSDYDRLLAAALEHGVDVHLVTPAPAGDRPLQEVPLPHGTPVRERATGVAAEQAVRRSQPRSPR